MHEPGLLIKGAAAWLGRQYRRRRPLPPAVKILGYHSISDRRGSSVTVPPARFRRQLGWLTDRHPVIDLDAALALKKTDHDRFVLAFDDGYADFPRNALPLLESAAAPSIVYVITGLIDDPATGYRFPAGAGKEPMRRADLVALARHSLVTVGSHSHGHRALPSLSDADARFELERSRDIVAELTGARGVHLSCPWGLTDRRIAELTRRWYLSALTGRGVDPPPLSPHRLRRIPIKDEPLSLFRERLAGNLVLEDLLSRASGRRRRHVPTAAVS